MDAGGDVAWYTLGGDRGIGLEMLRTLCDRGRAGAAYDTCSRSFTRGHLSMTCTWAVVLMIPLFGCVGGGGEAAIRTGGSAVRMFGAGEGVASFSPTLLRLAELPPAVFGPKYIWPISSYGERLSPGGVCHGC